MLALLTLGESSVEAARAALAHVQALLSDPTASKALRAQGILIPRAGISLAAPIPRPGKVICIGLNYPSGHPGAARSQYPVVFLKPASGLIGPDEPIRIPIVARDVAFEAELAVVIGTRAKNLSPARALDCIFGYTLANDVGARDLEQRTSQWTTGKLMDTFTPLGPALVTRDEVPDPGNLPILTRLNGRIVQQASTRDMYFPIPELISYLSGLTTLEPGDIILTGSPKTISGQPAPVLSLSGGDCIEVQIGDLGVLRNPVTSGIPPGEPRMTTTYPMAWVTAPGVVEFRQHELPARCPA